MPPLLELKNINKFYRIGGNSFHVLKNINLCVDQGDFVSIIGPSGSGKSTLLNILGCLDVPDGGSYAIDGQDTTRLTRAQLAHLRGTTFGFIFQQYHLVPHLNVVENVILPALYAGRSQTLATERALSLLEQLGLNAKAEYKPKELSGGQQQRICIARALLNGGKIIFADEPTGALDSQTGSKVLSILRRLNNDGHTILMVTHDTSIAQKAQRIIEIHDGVIVKDTRLGACPIYVPVIAPPALKQGTFAFFPLFWKLSMCALLSHSLRSLLTLLGIMIGIASVTCMFGLGKGAQQTIMADIGAMGSNTVEVFAGSSMGQKDTRIVKPLTMQDMEALLRLPEVGDISPHMLTIGTLRFGHTDREGYLHGVGASYFSTTNMNLSHGRLFMESDIKEARSVIILDHNTAETLFAEGLNPVGQSILFNNRPYQIVGVLAPQNAFSLPRDVLNVWIPYTAFASRVTRRPYFDSLLVNLPPGISARNMEERIIQVLEGVHPGFQFYTINAEDMRLMVNKAATTTTLVLAGISLISLIVAGVGVMNIMLVSTSERAGEIGICLAVGARSGDIAAQFMLEALIVSGAGGFCGVVLAFAVHIFFQKYVTQFPMVFSPSALVAAIVCATAVGILFGLGPACKASRQNPIDALFQKDA